MRMTRKHRKTPKVPHYHFAHQSKNNVLTLTRKLVSGILVMPW